MENDELYHHGIKGQKWGVRRFQNKDGSLTALGKKRLSSPSEKKSGDGLGGKIKTSIANKQASRQKKKAEKQAKEEALKEERKPVKSMTDEELRDRTKRLEAERNYLQVKKQVQALEPQHVSKGQAFAKHVGNNILKPALTEAGKKYLTDYLNKQAKKSLGVDIDDMAALKKEVDKLDLKKRKAVLDDYFEKRESKNSGSDKKAKKKDKSGKSDKSDDPEILDADPIYETPNSSRSKYNSDDVIDADWYEVPVNDPVVDERRRLGQSYVAGLLNPPR